ncbi:MAG TPA: hypothetical protein VMD25_08135 [Acidobacteriaceae bacterium]|nr:hypothetical protein [Acidobacteriaceae bacterium]
MKRELLVVSLACLFSSVSVPAQKAGAPPPAPQKPPQELQTRIVDFSDHKTLSGLPAAAVSGYPENCSADGVTFLEFYVYAHGSIWMPGDPEVIPDIYSIAADGAVKKIPRDIQVPNSDIYTTEFYPGADLIAALVTATPGKSPAGSQADNRTEYFISTAERDGSSSKLIPLDLWFEPLKVAVLDSGRFLVTGIDTLNKNPVLALLETDGTLLHMIDVDERPITSSRALGTIYKGLGGGTEQLVAASFSRADFVPYGSRVLLFVPGSQLPVLILGEDGEENAVRLKLPKGELPEWIFSSSGNGTWVIRTQGIGTFEALATTGGSGPVAQHLFEADPVTGETLRELRVDGMDPMYISCASSKQVVAVDEEPGNKETGTAPHWIIAVSSQ